MSLLKLTEKKRTAEHSVDDKSLTNFSLCCLKGIKCLPSFACLFTLFIPMAHKSFSDSLEIVFFLCVTQARCWS